MTKEDGKVVLFQVRHDEDSSDDLEINSELNGVSNSFGHDSKLESTIDKEIDLHCKELFNLYLQPLKKMFVSF